MNVRTGERSNGFTLIGLLAVLAMVALLAGLFSFSGALVQVKRDQLRCASNLRQVAMAALMYAEAEPLNRFPDCSGAFWPWDLSAAASEALLANGARREFFYCPALPEQNNDQHWNFTAQEDPPSGFRVIGYALAFKAAGRVRPTNITESLNPLPYRIGSQLLQPPPGERVLVADATLSNGSNEADRTRNRYRAIVGGSSIAHRAPHLNGNMPAGGNLVFLDGHTEWRRFEKMRVRTEGNPAFWW